MATASRFKPTADGGGVVSLTVVFRGASRKVWLYRNRRPIVASGVWSPAVGAIDELIFVMLTSDQSRTERLPIYCYPMPIGRLRISSASGL